MEPFNYNQHTAPLPLLTLNGDSGLDYATYFHSGSANYLGGEYESPTTMSVPNNLAGSLMPTTMTLQSNHGHRQKLDRRGHTKSRRGCFHCKRRRIKVKSEKLTAGPQDSD